MAGVGEAGIMAIAMAASTTASIAMQKAPSTPKIPTMPDLPKAPDLAPLDAQQNRQRAAATGQQSTILTGPQGLGASSTGKSVLGA